ncbi:MAG: CDP-alcohol phosphatidyltransferase family protein [Alphaproteobacteria bacterium]
MTLPNLISLFRLFSSFVIVYFISQDQFQEAFILFCLAACSDFVDGFFARYLKSYSRLGAYLDPLADKVLLSSVLIALTFYGVIPSWITFLAVLRDILILAGVASLWLAKKPFEVKPLWVSKLNTLFQICVVLISLYPNFSSPAISEALYYSMALTTLISAVFYSRMWLLLMKETSPFSNLQPPLSSSRFQSSTMKFKKRRSMKFK